MNNARSTLIVTDRPIQTPEARRNCGIERRFMSPLRGSTWMCGRRFPRLAPWAVLHRPSGAGDGRPLANASFGRALAWHPDRTTSRCASACPNPAPEARHDLAHGASRGKAYPPIHVEPRRGGITQPLSNAPFGHPLASHHARNTPRIAADCRTRAPEARHNTAHGGSRGFAANNNPNPAPSGAT